MIYPNVVWQDHPLGSIVPALNYSRPVVFPSRGPECRAGERRHRDFAGRGATA